MNAETTVRILLGLSGVTVVGIVRHLLTRPKLTACYTHEDIQIGQRECRELRAKMGIPPAGPLARWLRASRADHHGVAVTYSIWDEQRQPVAIRAVAKNGGLVFDIVGIDDVTFAVAGVDEDGAFLLNGDGHRKATTPGTYRCSITISNNHGGMGPYEARFVPGIDREHAHWIEAVV